jgi:Ca2+-binding EF-hand superfamily protein
MQLPGTFEGWDQNHDGTINRKEFVSGYTQHDYFEKWSSTSSAIPYETFSRRAFKSLDTDKNGTIVESEFEPALKPYLFGIKSVSFASWDINHDQRIDENEFVAMAASASLPALWDTSGDKRISKQELAGGMFYFCDTDGNRGVTQAEFESWNLKR